jgi:hypothetical protein
MSSKLDVDKLIKAINNDSNKVIMDLTSSKIKQNKNDMLQKLNLPRNQLALLHKKLKNYRYIDEMHELNYGTYVRWIDLSKDEVNLTNGGIVCEIKIADDGIHIVCKNNMNWFFEFHFGKCMVFQKLTEQEQILLSALDHISK